MASDGTRAAMWPSSRAREGGREASAAAAAAEPRNPISKAATRRGAAADVDAITAASSHARDSELERQFERANQHPFPGVPWSSSY